MNDLHIFSFGGGVQSMAVLVLAAQERLRYDAFVFAHVGEDSENPSTLDYLRDVALPFAQEHGQTFVTVRKERRVPGGGTVPTTLRTELERAQRSVIIPAYMANGAPGNRNCTTDFKIRVIDRWIRTQQPRPERVTVDLGISTDEFKRARDTNWHDTDSDTAQHPRKLGFWKRRGYPLIELRLNRSNCAALIQRAGLPLPPKSSCYFCPFTSKNSWIEMKRLRPDLFAEAVEVERLCNAKRLNVGRDGVFLHSSLKPLTVAVGDQAALFADEDADGCADGGYCMV